MISPVVLIVFNRPAVTRRSLSALRVVEPSRLLVVADGPRSTHPDDASLCTQVRHLVAGVDWPCQVETKFAERNLGLEANVELGLDWAFSRVDRAIILEDDCIADPTFFRYCDELLERYRDDERVWQIGGDRHGVPESMFGEASYAFTTWASVWGWATWADRWRSHRSVFDRDHAGAEERVGELSRTAAAQRTRPATPAKGSLVTKSAVRHFTFVAGNRDGDAYGWDHHWWVTIMAEGGLSTVPRLNLVENDGYGEGATHTRAEKAPEPAEAMPFPLVHPVAVALNPTVEAELELVLLRTDGRLSRLARRLIRPLWLRSLIRRFITLGPVWRIVRRAVAR